jgi:hypothetical protein
VPPASESWRGSRVQLGGAKALGHRRSGLVARPPGTGRPLCNSPQKRGRNLVKDSTRKSG